MITTLIVLAALVTFVAWDGSDHGALEFRECVGEDLKVKMGLTVPKMCRFAILKDPQGAAFGILEPL